MAYPFDVSHVYGPDGRVDMAGAEVVWDFGDGATGKGVVAPHQYAARGVYEVTADIRLADGDELSLGKLIHAESPVALRAGFESGFGDATGATTLKSVGAAVASVAGPDGKAADLNGGEIVYDVDEAFFSNTEYSVLFDFQKEAGSIGGKTRLFNLNGNITIILLEDQVYVAFNTDQTADWIKVGGLDIDNTDWHRLALTFSGKTGDVILYMDGDEVDRASGFKGHAQTYYSTKNLVIGDGFEGKIDNLVFLRGALSAAEVKAGVIPSEGSPLPVLEPGPAPEPEPDPLRAPAPSPSPSPDGGEGQGSTHPADLALIADAIGREDYAGLAGDLGMTLKAGRGDAEDNAVLSNSDAWFSAKSYGSDDVLVGDAQDNWLIAGSGNEIMHGGGGADDFRFSGERVDGAKSDVILDVDFDEGDRVILGSYDDGTFSSGGGANVFSDGGAVIVRSLEGFEGLAAASADVTLEAGPDGLTLAVAQASGIHEILLV